MAQPVLRLLFLRHLLVMNPSTYGSQASYANFFVDVEPKTRVLQIELRRPVQGIATAPENKPSRVFSRVPRRWYARAVECHPRNPLILPEAMIPCFYSR
jgi:hypothetical protein